METERSSVERKPPTRNIGGPAVDASPPPQAPRTPNRALRSHRELLDVAGAAAFLKISERHVRRLVAERRVPYLKVANSRLRFEVDALQDWLDAQRVEAIR